MLMTYRKLLVLISYLNIVHGQTDRCYLENPLDSTKNGEYINQITCLFKTYNIYYVMVFVY